MKGLFLLKSIVAAMSHYEHDENYNDLSEEEKSYMDFVDSCLYGEDELISDRSTKLMLLILRYSASENQMSDNEFVREKDKLLEGLSKENVETLECFMYCCINTMGIYSEERVQIRKLKKERNDKNDKSK